MFLESLGLSDAEVIGRGIDDIFKAQTAISLRDAVDRAPKSRAPIRVRVTQGRPDGIEACDVVVHPPVAGGPRGEIYLTLEPPLQTLALAEARQSALFDQMGPLSTGLIYVYDLAKSRTRYAHAGLDRMFGITEGTVDLESVGRRLHPSDAVYLESHVEKWRRLGDGEVCTANMRVKAAEGGWIWLQTRARVFARARDGSVRLVIGIVSDVTEEQRLKAALAETARALAEAEDKERRRIGRELHDSTAQHLIAIDLSLSALERRALFAETERPILTDMRSSLASAHREVRTFAYMLHPPRLEERGLETTLRTFLGGFGRRTGLEIDLRVTGLRWPLSDAVELAMFRIAQEGLMNVHRHAKAHRVSVRLHQARTLAWLEMEDDGIGIGAEPEAGVGISGMRARIEQLGGTLLLQNGSKGARLRATAPLERRGSGHTERMAGPSGVRPEGDRRPAGAEPRP